MPDEYVTMAVLRELLLTQERLFKQSMEILRENHKDDYLGFPLRSSIVNVLSFFSTLVTRIVNHDC